MRTPRAGLKRFDTTKLLFVLENKLGLGSVYQFVKFAEEQGLGIPRSSLYAMFSGGEGTDRRTWEIVLDFLGVSCQEVELSEEFDEVLSRIAKYDITAVVLKNEPDIRNVHKLTAQMVGDVRSALRGWGRRTPGSLVQVVRVGLFATDLASLLWRTKGFAAITDIDHVLELSRLCANALERNDLSAALAITARRFHEFPDSSDWCRPDKKLNRDEMTKIVRVFDAAAKNAALAEEYGSDRLGPDAESAVDYQLSKGYGYLLGNDFRNADLVLREIKDRISGLGPGYLRGYHCAFSGMLAERNDKTPKARKCLMEAISNFAHCVKEDHHILAACRMRLRNLGERHLPTSRDQDIDVLKKSAIRYSDLIDMDALRQEVENRRKVWIPFKTDQGG